MIAPNSIKSPPLLYRTCRRKINHCVAYLDVSIPFYHPFQSTQPDVATTSFTICNCQSWGGTSFLPPRLPPLVKSPRLKSLGLSQGGRRSESMLTLPYKLIMHFDMHSWTSILSVSTTIKHMILILIWHAYRRSSNIGNIVIVKRLLQMTRLNTDY